MQENDIILKLEEFLKNNSTDSDAFFKYATELFDAENVTSFNFESIIELLSENVEPQHLKNFQNGYRLFVKEQKEKIEANSKAQDYDELRSKYLNSVRIQLSNASKNYKESKNYNDLA